MLRDGVTPVKMYSVKMTTLKQLALMIRYVQYLVLLLKTSTTDQL